MPIVVVAGRRSYPAALPVGRSTHSLPWLAKRLGPIDPFMPALSETGLPAITLVAASASATDPASAFATGLAWAFATASASLDRVGLRLVRLVLSLSFPTLFDQYLEEHTKAEVASRQGRQTKRQPKSTDTHSSKQQQPPLHLS